MEEFLEILSLRGEKGVTKGDCDSITDVVRNRKILFHLYLQEAKIEGYF